eukprot:356375-Chlamydomonas_euryale.AAC.8
MRAAVWVAMRHQRGVSSRRICVASRALVPVALRRALLPTHKQHGGSLGVQESPLRSGRTVTPC